MHSTSTFTSECGSDSGRTKVITIEGNIGSGKSTLLKILKRNLDDVQIIKEPVTQWQAINNNPRLNLLELFYQDPKRWAYTFQSYAYYSRLRQWSEIRLEEKVAVAERSVLSDKYIFAMNGKKAGFFNEIEWALYEEYFDWLTSKFHADKINGIIYLNTRPEICHQRIMKRGRSEEKDGIPMEYLESIYHRHEEWLQDKENVGFPVLMIDGSQMFDTEGDAQNEVVRQIKEFIEKI